MGQLTAASAWCAASAETTATRAPNLMAPVPSVRRSMAHFPLAHSQPKMHRRRVCHSNFPQKRSRRRAAGLCLVVMPQPLQCGGSEEMRALLARTAPPPLRALRPATDGVALHVSQPLLCVKARTKTRPIKNSLAIYQTFPVFPTTFAGVRISRQFKSPPALAPFCQLFCLSAPSGLGFLASGAELFIEWSVRESNCEIGSSVLSPCVRRHWTWLRRWLRPRWMQAQEGLSICGGQGSRLSYFKRGST